MGSSGLKLEDQPDFSRWTVGIYATDMRKLRRIQMAREAEAGQRPSIARLVHEAVREMQEP